MAETDERYSRAKPDIVAVVEPLFDLSEGLVRRRGSFLPHGAVLTEDAKVELVTAGPPSGNDYTNATEVLPVLHVALRFRAKQSPVRALGVAEDVTVTVGENRPTRAIKVLFEHTNGLTAALYLPFRKRLLRGYEFGASFTVPAKPEVNAWGQDGA